MGSGPRAGLREINIPDLQPGSSIMPGKVNPVIPEAVCMVSAQVIGNDAAIAFGGAAGNFELNVMLPMLARNILESIRLLASVSRLFADRCIAGISANADRARQYAEGSPSIVTPLNRYIGYEEAAKVAKQAVAEGKTIREVVLERGYVDDGKLTLEQLDEALDVLRMTGAWTAREPLPRPRCSTGDESACHRGADPGGMPVAGAAIVVARCRACLGRRPRRRWSRPLRETEWWPSGKGTDRALSTISCVSCWATRAWSA